MTKYTIKLNERREVAEGTMAFHLEKPPGFQFKAGQYMNVTLIDPPETDAEGNIRRFSISSAPSVRITQNIRPQRDCCRSPVRGERCARGIRAAPLRRQKLTGVIAEDPRRLPI